MVANKILILIRNQGYPLFRNNIKIIGKPFIEVTNWDKDKEILQFNYCFPIPKDAKFVANPNVKFKTIPAVKGLKATYFGNFRTSESVGLSRAVTTDE